MLETKNSDLRRAMFWVTVVAVGVGLFMLLTPFFAALLWALALSILIYPYYKRLTKKGWNPTVASLWATFLVAFVIVLPFLGVGTVAGVQVSAFVSDLNSELSQDGNGVTAQGFSEYLEHTIDPLLAKVGAQNFSVRKWLSENGQLALRSAGSALYAGLKNLVLTIGTMAISVFTMFFMLRDGHQLLEPALDVSPLPREKTLALFDRLALTVRSVFNGVVLVALIQGTIAGATYWALGVPGAFLLWCVTIVLCCIPLLGSPIVFVPVAIKLFLDGQTIQALVMLGVGFGIVSQVDNLLRPYFIGLSTKMPTIVVFFALLGGVLLFGPVGLVIGPMLVALASFLFEMVREMRRLENGAPPLAAEPSQAPG
ncbi:MAG: AI-2E family transporter [Fimbriimonadaceae bacterium]|nr:MAG: AI-2E family transporter [Fimbriimonadaceae bacterium]